ncbi:unnamed protein product [Tetraodon nigroviridis]|uniref:(spotted green pufferfish) hypothetical protein n=1 Tax=Tetraodon nigroviridis TaxID=99883 RepID=Q4SLW6_TETNG|nr:unnamed protein product [Tetraodon nigroviridis]
MAQKPRGCQPAPGASALFPLHGTPAGEANSIYSLCYPSHHYGRWLRLSHSLP